MTIRPANEADHERLFELVTEAFGPITWYRKAEARFGQPGGCDWRELWRQRIEHALDKQINLVGEQDGEIVAFSSGAYNPKSRIGFLDILAVTQDKQGGGLGREMLRACLDDFRDRGAEFANLECLTDNDVGNALYEAEGFEEVMRSIRWFKKL